MRASRRLKYSPVLCLLLVPGTLDAALVVKSSTARRYWFIRQDLMTNLSPNLNVRLQRIEAGPYGPFPINGRPIPNTKAGVVYVVFPECRGRMKLSGELATGDQASVEVNCL
jgi:hypothetical protein